MTTMTARVSWLDGMMFVGESGSGHTVVMDGAAQHGGRDHGIRPMEMLLLSLGGCTIIDVVKNRKRNMCCLKILSVCTASNIIK